MSSVSRLLLLLSIFVPSSLSFSAYRSFLGVVPTHKRVSVTVLHVANPASFHTDEEWHPNDPAYTTPQLMAGLWFQIAQVGSMAKGETMTVIYPQMSEKLSTPRYLNTLLGHLDVCKDVCDHFGISTTLVPYTQKARIVGFTAKSFKSPDAKDDNMEFGYDPFWDDGTDFDTLYAGIDEQYDGPAKDQYPTIQNKVPDDDEVIIQITKTWVGKLMSDMGVCPFTQGPDKAGLPVGEVFYKVDRSTGVEDAYSKYWEEVVRLEQNKEKDLSTSLLILPEFFLDNVELFESFSTTLTQALTALQVEDLLQLVFFHPQWSFRDGSARAGEGQAANYARRSPWPMINLLRTSQVRLAQKGIPTGLVYKQNEKTLTSIGVDKLETMLRLRDWSEISDLKVNRREMDALKIAQDFQDTGALKVEDISLEHDATPAANKVDRRQVEEGNLVNVLQQALDKRLGPQKMLSGPETSASAMAADFLIQELDKIGACGPTESSNDQGPPHYLDARQARLEAARKALLEDLAGDQSQGHGGRDMTDVYFGKSAIPENVEDERYNKGMNPDSFY